MDLEELIAILLDGWDEPIRWAERLVDHSIACNGRALRMTSGSLKHYLCECVGRIEYRAEHRQQLPLLTQLFEAKWAIPISGKQGGGNPSKVEAPMPGNLIRPDELIHKLTIAAQTALSDWAIEYQLPIVECLKELLRYTKFADDEERQDAAHLIGVPVHEALVELGYRHRRVVLRDFPCPQCAGPVSVEREDAHEVTCDRCGWLATSAQWLDMLAAKVLAARYAAVEAGDCRKGHAREQHGRLGKDGRWHCRECDRLRKAAKAATLASTAAQPT